MRRRTIVVTAVGAMIVLGLGVFLFPASPATANSNVETSNPLDAFRQGEIALPVIGLRSYSIVEQDQQAHLGSYEYNSDGERVLVSRHISYDVKDVAETLTGTIVFNEKTGSLTGWLYANGTSSSPSQNIVVEVTGNWDGSILKLETIVDGPDSRMAYDRALEDFKRRIRGD